MDKKDNKDVFISYIVPCYNVGKYLPKCLESLAKQKIKEGAGIEYILVNDGSKDDTLSILNEFAANDNRAIVIDQDNKGVCAARNNGLKLAKGKYVYFHDGDDILTDEASLLVYNESQKNDSDIIIPNAYSVHEDDLNTRSKWNTFGKFKAGVYESRDFADKIDALPISVKIYKRETLVNNSVFFDEDLKVGEVYTFFFHVLAFSKYVTLTDGCMMIWVVRDEGTTIGANLKRDIKILDTLHRIDKYADEFKFNIRAKSSFHTSLFSIANTFSMYKYSIMPVFDSEIRAFLMRVKKDWVYKKTLRYFIFENPHFGRRFLNASILLFFPVEVFCLKIRLGIVIKLKQRFLNRI